MSRFLRTMALQPDRTGFVQAALQMGETVTRFLARARAYFYDVVLSRHGCPECGGRLSMTGESRCRCDRCGLLVDPTVAFQRCSECGGQPRLNVRRYSCLNCGIVVPSRFVFDGLVFDADYFRQRMAEHRERRRDLRDRVRQMLANSRSAAIGTNAIEPGHAADLFAALNQLVLGAIESPAFERKAKFDLRAYEAQVQDHIGPFPLNFDDIQPLVEDPRLDRIWRFIAIIFLAHAGRVDVWQEHDTIMVMQLETDRERQDISGDLEETSGFEGLVG